MFLATSALAALAVLAAGLSAITLMIVLRKRAEPSLAEALKEVHTLQSDLNDLHDKVDHWQRRDRVRTLRAGVIPQQAAPEEAVPGAPGYKQALRRRAAKINSIGTSK